MCVRITICIHSARVRWTKRFAVLPLRRLGFPDPRAAVAAKPTELSGSPKPSGATPAARPPMKRSPGLRVSPHRIQKRDMTIEHNDKTVLCAPIGIRILGRSRRHAARIGGEQ